MADRAADGGEAGPAARARPGRRSVPGARAPTQDGDAGELALRARAGDRAAFGELYERYAPLVHAVALSRVSFEEARDLVQEVFLVALRTIDELREPARVGPWLATIARNRARDRVRADGRRGALGPIAAAEGPRVAEVEDPARAPGERAAEAEEAAAALAAIRALPKAYRATLMLRLVEGLDGPAIAERCGMTPGSVRVNLCRGMKLLRERLTGSGA